MTELIEKGADGEPTGRAYEVVEPPMPGWMQAVYLAAGLFALALLAYVFFVGIPAMYHLHHVLNS